ncbi:hypothetical protein SUGI_0693090 [Cryptomeria japonica]|uniref:uncharacterized protein LOC131856536 n=1 Tax=Cryptomeria japonica TaxID=3369 RepID=UPI002414C3CF|nr:uncharacterized protein LOC131856536 [Cryptomeria japonica]GLJ34463.1 hypothetical protein SUGI_0693090 [Cryptomeria japonica]
MENTVYHESYKIIEILGNYPWKSRPFLYNAPKLSQQKEENTHEIESNTFKQRSTNELVVTVLLATMSFTVAFIIPGGFKTKGYKLGFPLLIQTLSFKMFIIIDCVAFFLSLSVAFAWQMATPLTRASKTGFLNITNMLLSFTYAFTTYGFISPVYSILEHNKLA